MLFTRPLPEGDRARLDALYARLQTERRTFVGYPCNQDEDFGELARFLEFILNNVGDPFAGRSYIRQNTHEFEREVIQEFARMTRAPEGEYWGYVTNGGTEGNMYGLYLARELLPDGVVYFSEDTHYSVAKILRLLHARNIMIKSQRNGELDYQDLKETLRLHRDVPPLLFANIGTTMKGAVDDLVRVREILEDLAIPRYYIHCDAALSGVILPFVPDPQPFDFADGAHSISISGHKMIGAPLPCGVALALRRNVERVARSVEYVGILDTTLSGSRNALSPLMLWYALRRAGPDGFRRCVETCLARADYAVARFAARGISAWRNRNSITVVFPRPGDAVFRKWQVAPYRDVGHLIAMPHVTEAMIDEFVEDVAAHPPRTGRGKAGKRGATGRPHGGFTAMKHITVLLEAPTRDVADLAQVLADRGVNIEDIDVEESEQTGVANLTVDLYDEALHALRDAGFRAVSEDALVIRLRDEPGALARVAVRFKAAGIGIRSMHILGRAGSSALVTIVSERPEEAKQLVRDLLVSGV